MIEFIKLSKIGNRVTLGDLEGAVQKAIARMSRNAEVVPVVVNESDDSLDLCEDNDYNK